MYVSRCDVREGVCWVCDVCGYTSQSFASPALSRACENAELTGIGVVVILGVQTGNADVIMICDCEVQQWRVGLVFHVI